ncbi:MAG: J domain-containing protein [Hyphomicrobiales bacterium]|nr:J domain-containing protein [Hyphomicrobiales bacterium]
MENPQNTPDLSEIDVHIDVLEHRIVKAGARLRSETQSYDQLKQQVDDCMAGYLGNIGRLYDELQILSRLSKTGGVKPEALVQPAAQPSRTTPTARVPSLYEEELKTVYRRLAKLYHPDVSVSRETAGLYFERLNAVYKAGDLQALLDMEEEYLSEQAKGISGSVQKLERLEQKYEAVQQAIDNVVRKSHTLRQSPEYRLYQELQLQQEGGQQLMSKVRRRLVSRIESKKEALKKEGVLQ